MSMKGFIARRAMVTTAISRRGIAALHSVSAAAAGAAATTASLGTCRNTRLLAPAVASGAAAHRPMSSGATGDGSGGGGGGGGRFSDDLEKLISRAGEKAGGRGAKGKGAEVALTAEGAGAVASQGGGGEAAGEEEDPKLSARAMKFRAMISKLRPQKKKVVIKVTKRVEIENLQRPLSLEVHPRGRSGDDSLNVYWYILKAVVTQASPYTSLHPPSCSALSVPCCGWPMYAHFTAGVNPANAGNIRPRESTNSNRAGAAAAAAACRGIERCCSPSVVTGRKRTANLVFLAPFPPFVACAPSLRCRAACKHVDDGRFSVHQ